MTTETVYLSSGRGYGDCIEVQVPVPQIVAVDEWTATVVLPSRSHVGKAHTLTVDRRSGVATHKGDTCPASMFAHGCRHRFAAAELVALKGLRKKRLERVEEL